MPTFRVHTADGRKFDVEAATASEARLWPSIVGRVVKVKRLKEKK